MNDDTENPNVTTIDHGIKPVEIMKATPVANLAAALAAVMLEIEPVKKGGTNPHFHYKFAKMEDVLSEVGPRLAKHGLVIMQSEVGREVADNMVYATFEFTLLHKSGEVWPNRPRMTGMCRLRDNKGGLDDKAMNKCHTAARKYFLLGLFQIQTGDDADKDGHDEPREEKTETRGPMTGPPGARRTPIPDVFPTGTKPHRIVPARNETASTWANKYMKAVQSSTEPETVMAWNSANRDLLDQLKDEAAELRQKTYDEEKATQHKLSAAKIVDTADLRTRPEVKRPVHLEKDLNPEQLREKLNKIWSEIHDVAMLDASWAELIDPIQNDLFPPDLSDLSKLWGEHATRIEQEAQR